VVLPAKVIDPTIGGDVEAGDGEAAAHPTRMNKQNRFNVATQGFLDINRSPRK
jgi:hypothetical protein